MSDYAGPDRRRRVNTIDPQQFGALVANVVSLKESNARLEDTLKEFMAEQKARQEAHAAESHAEYERLAARLRGLEAALDGHIQKHHLEQVAAQRTGPFEEFKKKFFETLYQALALILVGGLGWVALQYLTTLGGTP